MSTFSFRWVGGYRESLVPVQRSVGKGKGGLRHQVNDCILTAYISKVHTPFGAFLWVLSPFNGGPGPSRWGSGPLCILRNREDAVLPLIIRVGRAGFTLYPVFNSMRLVPTFFGEPGSLPPFTAGVICRDCYADAAAAGAE